MRSNATGFMAGLALCTATLGATTLHATPTKHSVRVTDIYALTAAPVILAQMDEIDALSERISRLRNLLIDEDIDGFWQAVDDVPEIKQPTEGGQFSDIMRYAVWSNDLELIIWLNENCPLPTTFWPVVRSKRTDTTMRR